MKKSTRTVQKWTAELLQGEIYQKFPYVQILEMMPKGMVKALDSRHGEFIAPIGVVLKEGSYHPRVRKTLKNLPFEEIALRISELHSHLQLLEFQSTKSDAKFLDSEFGEFIANFAFVRALSAMHPERSRKLRKQIAELESTKQARIKTTNELYHCDNVSQNEKIKSDRLATFQKTFGGHPMSHPIVKAKVKKTNLENFGCHPFADTTIQQKIRKTNIEKYGTPYASSNLDVKAKIKKTRIERGLNQTIQGLMVNDFIQQNGLDVSSSVLISVKKRFGEDACLGYHSSRSDIENIIQEFLKSKEISYIYDHKIAGRRYDFLIQERKIVIECDGLYWHSELKAEKYDAKDKLEHYNSNGYRALFFRQDEIYEKTEIVNSIIHSHLGLNKRIFARKCEIKDVSSKISGAFFEENHLMGKGSGQTFALVFDNKIQCAMRVIRKPMYVEISRFCSALNTTIVGGFSKLLQHVIRVLKPKNIVSFVDMRYGDGHSLTVNGFVEKSCHISFRWTNGTKTAHRMQYRGNSGYDHNLYKIWDCGQKRFELKVDKEF